MFGGGRETASIFDRTRPSQRPSDESPRGMMAVWATAVRPAQRQVRSEIPGARDEGATPKARPRPMVDVTGASIGVGQERTHLFEQFLLLGVCD